MNDMYAQQKINHNLQAMLQCEQIAAVQASAVQTVVINIKMRLGTIEDECRRLQASVKAERQSIFETVSVLETQIGCHQTNLVNRPVVRYSADEGVQLRWIVS